MGYTAILGGASSEEGRNSSFCRIAPQVVVVDFYPAYPASSIRFFMMYSRRSGVFFPM
jgi:hypothetical protein